MKSRMSLFVVEFSCLLNKEGKATMLIGDIDIAGLMIHLHKIEKDKFKIERILEKRNLRHQVMSLHNRRVMQTSHLSNISQRDLLHHLLVHLHQGTKVS